MVITAHYYRNLDIREVQWRYKKQYDLCFVRGGDFSPGRRKSHPQLKWLTSTSSFHWPHNIALFGVLFYINRYEIYKLCEATNTFCDIKL